MKAEIRSIHGPDTYELDKYYPDAAFCILLQFLIGPKDLPGEESFDLIVCSPSWLDNQKDEVISGQHMLIMKRFSIEIVRSFMQRVLRNIDGDNWRDVARQLDLIARWEFHDYKAWTDCRPISL